MKYLLKFADFYILADYQNNCLIINFLFRSLSWFQFEQIVHPTLSASLPLQFIYVLIVIETHNAFDSEYFHTTFP